MTPKETLAIAARLLEVEGLMAMVRASLLLRDTAEFTDRLLEARERLSLICADTCSSEFTLAVAEESPEAQS